MAGKPIKELEVDSFYTMFTLRQVQKALGCSRATLYRTLKIAKIERYYIPNHPGAKYIWGCRLYKLLKTPAGKKLTRKFGRDKTLPDVECTEVLKGTGVSRECLIQAMYLGLIPVEENQIPWWFEKAVTGLLVLPLPYK